MAQSPMKLDAIQIEPESGDTLTISRGDDGSLQFADAQVTTAISLTRLAGLSANASILTVGSDSQYSSIQDAIDAVPATASSTDPYTVLVGPGIYAENITIEKDGISLVGAGLPTISAATGDAVTLSAAVSTRPRGFVMEGFKVVSSEAGSSCVRITGGAGSTIGADGILLKDLELQPSGVGSRSLRASTVGKIVGVGGDWSTQATTYVELAQCASVLLKGIRQLSDVSVSHTDAAALSSTDTTSYSIQECGEVGDMLISLSGESELLVSGCPSVGDVTFNGDRTSEINCSVVGDVTMNEDSVCVLNATKHQALSGDGVVSVSNLNGEVLLDNQAFLDVVLDVSQPDTDYTICVEIAPTSTVASVHTKTVNSFRVQFDQPRSGRLRWHLLRS